MKLKLFNFDDVVINFLLDERIFPYLVIDKFANYVVQSAVTLCNEHQKEIFIKV